MQNNYTTLSMPCWSAIGVTAAGKMKDQQALINSIELKAMAGILCALHAAGISVGDNNNW
jgi:hypothetical protein